MLIKIILGLIGLGIVVFIHELGHFIAAKKAGIHVEVFSIGWGKKLFSFTRQGTEYRISLIPIGGYCKMKGDDLLKEAIEKDSDKIPDEENSFFSASPWRRIFVGFAGPFFNFLFAIASLSLVWFIGFTTYTYGNNIVIASEFSETEKTFPAEKAGLKTGDKIISIEGNKIEHYNDLQKAIAPNPNKKLTMLVLRDGEEIEIDVTPRLNPDTGAGQIGTYAWIEPIIGKVREGSPAHMAGLKSGDEIIAVNDKEIKHAMQFQYMLKNANNKVDIDYLRDGSKQNSTMVIDYNENGAPNTGIQFKHLAFTNQTLNPAKALFNGTKQTLSILGITVKSLGVLFQGVNLQKAVQGPLRITYYIGDVAAQGFSSGIHQGFNSIITFLSLLSVALCFMNLLPIPALDGGLILLFLVEGIIIRKPLSPKVIARYQAIGMFIVLGLIFFAIAGDILFLANR